MAASRALLLGFLIYLLSLSPASTSTSKSAASDPEPDLDDLAEWYLSNLPHRRDKRFLWMTEEKRMVFPPGTQLVLTPTLAMPLLRYPPTGVDANLTISTPITIGFDAMGMTDNQNPIGLLPFLNPGVGFVGRRRKRDLPEPEMEPHEIPGGERVLLFEAVEDFLFKLGLDGKPCLLRAICETHESPLIGYGLLGEVLELLLTASKSPYSRRLSDYIEAERMGREEGECWRYFKECPKSFYKTTSRNKYTKEAQASTLAHRKIDLNLIRQNIDSSDTDKMM